MPSSYSHFIFGNEILAHIENTDIKTILIKHQELFNIGLHGPDILFFYKPYKRKDYSSIGHKMHKDAAYSFFNTARKIITESNNPDASMAYTLGFLCHFILDSKCHGYVAKIMEKTHVSHHEIESEYDRRLMEKEKINPLTKPLVEHLVVSKSNCESIAPFFNLDSNTIYKALKGMQFYDKQLLAPTLLKRSLLYSGMKITFLYKPFQGLVMNYKKNTKLNRYFFHFDTLFKEAIPLAITKIEEYYTLLPLDSYYFKNYK